MPDLLSCWGKTSKDPVQVNLFHPALFHMLDVGFVAHVLLSNFASPRWRNVLAAAFGTDPELLQNWLPFVISLHDIGKISSQFQGQVIPQKQRLITQGFSFDISNLGPGKADHGTVGQAAVMYELDDRDLPKPIRLILRDMAGGHHGWFLAPATVRQTRAMLQASEPPLWAALRRECVSYLKETLLAGLPQELKEPADRSAAVMALTGFTILCDWLGSDEQYFQIASGMDWRDYLPLSRARAVKVVSNSGFLTSVMSSKSANFTAIFPDLSNPRPLQLAVDAISSGILAKPSLTIIEAPTGEGKTEAALTLAHRIALQKGSDELFYALPTTATSNQMFGRVQRYVLDQLGMDAAVKLVHGQAFLVEDDLRLKALSNGGYEAEPLEALEWFGPKKKTLLSGFGVGTVDQAELGALNVRHNALRLIGLAGKTVILDEVHAYDTYMTAVIARLLQWLSALGTSVILLSATLPQKRRAELVQAYNPNIDLNKCNQTAYPSILTVSDNGWDQQLPDAVQPAREVALTPLKLDQDSPEQKAAWLLEQVSSGGCACWITNTVERAQKLFAALDAMAPGDMPLMLIHARFPLENRARLEDELVRLYGAKGQRPARGIVIGTQVLEQSLDLDFDLMVSDLAPVDLLLQRAGRLHRHQRPRPDGWQLPHLFVYLRENENGNLDLKGDDYIYSEYILRRTAQVLESRTSLSLPAEYRPLIEAVYAADPPQTGDPLWDCWRDLQKKQIDAGVIAEQHLLPAPEKDDTFTGAVANLSFEESETGAGWRVAQTRLGEPSVTVVPLVRKEGKAFCAGISDGYDLDEAVPRDIQLMMLQQSLRISRKEVVEYFQAVISRNELPKMFTASALLKDVVPLWLEDGKAPIQGEKRTLELSLDDRLGLVIQVV